MSRNTTRCPKGKALFEALLTARGEDLRVLTRDLEEHLSSCPVCMHFLEEEGEEEDLLLSFPYGIPPLPRRRPLPHLGVALAGAMVVLLVLILVPLWRSPGPGPQGFILLRGEGEVLPISGLTLLLEVSGNLFPLPLEGAPPPSGVFRLQVQAQREGTLSLFASTGDRTTLLAQVHLREGEKRLLPEEGWFPPVDRLLLRFSPVRESPPHPEGYLIEFTGGGERR